MKRTLLTTIIIFLAGIPLAFAQSNPRYLVLLKDKAGSPFPIQNPSAYLSERAIARRTKQGIAVTSRDLPVNPAYVTGIRGTGAQVIYTSRWFNAALVEASAAQLDAIKKLPYYSGIELNLPVANLSGPTSGVQRVTAPKEKLAATEELDYGNMNAQLALMDVPAIHQQGFQGEGMLVAIMDNGFRNGDQLGFLESAREEKRIVDTHDFVAREANVYNDGSHGLNVLSIIAAYEPAKMIGGAFKASFALYRTENDAAESPYEEITWLLAAERADSLGVDVINTSLGYSQFDGEFGNASYNYTYEDLNGNTAIISRAARFATRTGMLVVNSAGNEGNKPWKYVSPPADVDSVLTVGAVTYDRSYSASSSVGPTANGVQKPDVAAVGVGAVVGTTTGSVGTSNGTSFSSPLIAGLATILWQAYPKLTAQQLIQVLKKSGHQADKPDNLLGYGVPSALKAQQIIGQEYTPLGTEKSSLQAVVLSPNPANDHITLSIPSPLVGKKATLKLVTVNGIIQQHSQENLQSRHSIPTGQLSAGLYVVQIQVEGKERSLKFIKR